MTSKTFRGCTKGQGFSPFFFPFLNVNANNIHKFAMIYFNTVWNFALMKLINILMLIEMNPHIYTYRDLNPQSQQWDKNLTSKLRE